MSEITTKELKEIAAAVKKRYYLRPGDRTAIVSTGAIEYGIGILFQGFAEIDGVEFDYKVFRKISEAKEWLGV